MMFQISHHIVVIFITVYLLGSPVHSAEPVFETEIEQASNEKDWSKVITIIREHRNEIPDATRRLVLAYLSAQKREEALQELNRLIDNTNRSDYIALRTLAAEQFLTDESSAYFKQGIDHFRASRFEDARLSLIEALKLEPDNALILFYLGRLNLAMDQVPLAVERLQLCLRLNPLRNEAAPFLARALWLKGDAAEAIKLFDKSPYFIGPAKVGQKDLFLTWAYAAQFESGKKAQVLKAINGLHLENHPQLFIDALAKGWVKTDSPLIQKKINQALQNLPKIEKSLNAEKVVLSHVSLWKGFLKVEDLKTKLETYLLIKETEKKAQPEKVNQVRPKMKIKSKKTRLN